MARYEVNDVPERAHALMLVVQYVLDSDWGVAAAECGGRERLPRAALVGVYAAWHLGLTVGANDGTKARYAFVCGDFRRIPHPPLSYRASTEPPSGPTRRSSWRLTTC